ncbi:TolB family protein [Microbulbifer sp. 2201CG32-9]|uniref:TolB family protein n=1 Tax=Microbulbifer sp. 2201CG32-9 TaxID=3232309 RepID=UPI00345BFE6B
MKSIYPSVALSFSVLIMGIACEAKPTLYTIAYYSNKSGHGEIYLTDVEGTSKFRLTNRANNDGYPAWSPDGKHIAMYAYHDGNKTWSIHTINIDGTNRKRLTHAKNKKDYAPTWSPDGKRIAFAREYRDTEKTLQTEIWIMNSDGSGQTQIKPLSGGAPDFTTDGRIVFNSAFKDKKNEISIADIDGENIIQLTNNEAEEWHPEVSPNGKQIVFMSDRDGNYEIYSMDIDGTNQKRLTFNNVRDSTPSWSPDGSKIIFTSRDNEGEKHVYIMNKNGTSVRKFISDGATAAWLKKHK